MTNDRPARALIFDMDGTIVDNMRFHDDAWYVLLAPAGTPQPIIAKLHMQAVEIVQQPQMVENFGKIGLDVACDPPG